MGFAKMDIKNTYPHKRAAVILLMIRAYRLLKNSAKRKKEIQKIFKNSMNKAYPIKTLKRWNIEAKNIAGKPKEVDKNKKTISG